MSINESAATIAQVKMSVPLPPDGYGTWFTGEYKDIPVDPATIAQRQEAIESYYAGYTAAYNNMKGTAYELKFAWSESASEQEDCLCYTLHVFVSPPPVTLTAYQTSATLAASLTASSDPEEQIDPPKPPPPPPPYL